jgi:hypothetical protein
VIVAAFQIVLTFLVILTFLAVSMFLIVAGLAQIEQERRSAIGMTHRTTEKRNAANGHQMKRGAALGTPFHAHASRL